MATEFQDLYKESYGLCINHLQETVSDVHPKVFERKFGKLEPEERAYLTDIIDQIIKKLTDAQKLV